MQEECIILINKYAHFRGITESFCIQIHKTNTNRYEGGTAVEKLPANQDIWVQSLGWEDSLE